MYCVFLDLYTLYSILIFEISFFGFDLESGIESGNRIEVFEHDELR